MILAIINLILTSSLHPFCPKPLLSSLPSLRPSSALSFHLWVHLSHPFSLRLSRLRPTAPRRGVHRLTCPMPSLAALLHPNHSGAYCHIGICA